MINLCVFWVTDSFVSCGDDNGAGPSNPVLYPSSEAKAHSISTGESIEFKDQSVGNPSAWKVILLQFQWHRIQVVKYMLTAKRRLKFQGQLHKSILLPIGTLRSELRKKGGSYEGYFNGSIDGFVVYDKALTDQEVANLYGQLIGAYFQAVDLIL